MVTPIFYMILAIGILFGLLYGFSYPDFVFSLTPAMLIEEENLAMKARTVVINPKNIPMEDKDIENVLGVEREREEEIEDDDDF